MKSVDSLTYLQLAETTLKDGDKTKALEYINTAISIEDSSLYRKFAGDVLMQLDRKEEALNHYRAGATFEEGDKSTRYCRDMVKEIEKPEPLDDFEFSTSPLGEAEVTKVDPVAVPEEKKKSRLASYALIGALFFGGLGSLLGHSMKKDPVTGSYKKVKSVDYSWQTTEVKMPVSYEIKSGDVLQKLVSKKYKTSDPREINNLTKKVVDDNKSKIPSIGYDTKSVFDGEVYDEPDGISGDEIRAGDTILLNDVPSEARYRVGKIRDYSAESVLVEKGKPSQAGKYGLLGALFGAIAGAAAARKEKKDDKSQVIPKKNVWQDLYGSSPDVEFKRGQSVSPKPISAIVKIETDDDILNRNYKKAYGFTYSELLERYHIMIRRNPSLDFNEFFDKLRLKYAVS